MRREGKERVAAREKKRERGERKGLWMSLRLTYLHPTSSHSHTRTHSLSLSDPMQSTAPSTRPSS